MDRFVAKACCDEAVRGAIARLEFQHERALFRKEVELVIERITLRCSAIIVVSFVAFYFAVRLT